MFLKPKLVWDFLSNFTYVNVPIPRYFGIIPEPRKLFPSYGFLLNSVLLSRRVHIFKILYFENESTKILLNMNTPSLHDLICAETNQSMHPFPWLTVISALPPLWQSSAMCQYV